MTPGVPGVKPCRVKMIDAVTKEHVETIEPDAVMVCTGRAPFSEGLGLADAKVKVERGFVQVNEKMQALGEDGNPIDGLWCIGDLNGKMMLAHAASAQGISAVENMCGDEHIVNHDAVPAACFTHPEIAMVGPTEEQAREKAEAEGYEIGVSTGNFRANSKALAEGEADGIAKASGRHPPRTHPARRAQHSPHTTHRASLTPRPRPWSDSSSPSEWLT